MTTHETASAVTGRGLEVKETVAEQGGQVASTARSEAQNVAGTAKDQAQQVVGEATAQARDLAHELRTQVEEQAATQRDRLVGTLRELAQELREMADGGTTNGLASELARQAADRVQGVTGYVENSQGGDLLDDVRAFARRKPGTFLLGAAAAGVLAGRLTRGAKAAASSPSGSSTGATGGTGYVGYTGTGAGYAGTPTTGGAYTGRTGVPAGVGETYPGETYTSGPTGTSALGGTAAGGAETWSRHIDPDTPAYGESGPRHAAGEPGYGTTAAGAMYETDPVYGAERGATDETIVPGGGRDTDPREPR